MGSGGVQTSVLVIGTLGIVVILLIVFSLLGKKEEEKVLPTWTGPNGGGNPPEVHSRPICEDSTLFRATVNDKVRGCEWVSHKPNERCATFGTDNNGNQVTAKHACFKACDSGNCRRRLGHTLDLVDLMEPVELN